MKRLLLIVLLLLMTASSSVAEIQDHPNYANIQALVDSIVTVIQNHQAEFFVLNQVYFQGLRIPEIGEDENGDLLEADKLDGIRTEKININLKPHDFDTTWGEFDANTFKVNVRLPVHIEVGVYRCTDEHNREWGWYFTAEFWYNGIDPDEFGHTGNHWIYHHQEGPEPRPNWIYDTWFCKQDGLN